MAGLMAMRAAARSMAVSRSSYAAPALSASLRAQFHSSPLAGYDGRAKSNHYIEDPKYQAHKNTAWPNVPEESRGLTNLMKDKTGQTGGLVLGGGVLTYLISKEYIVFHSETCVVVGFGGILYYVWSQFGSQLAAHIDRSIDTMVSRLEVGRDLERDAFQKGVNVFKGWVEEVEPAKQEMAKMELVEAVLEHENAKGEFFKTLQTRVLGELNRAVAEEQRIRGEEHAKYLTALEAAVRANFTADKVPDTTAQCIAELKAMPA